MAARPRRNLLLLALCGLAMGASALPDARYVTLPPSPEAREAFDSLRCLWPQVHGDKGVARPDEKFRIEDFLNRFPSSSYVPEARLMLADSYFFSHEYPLALSVYSTLQPSWFSGSLRSDYTYRYAFSLIKTGYYDEALPLLRSLRSDASYANAAAFYIAYVDYVNGDYDRAYEGFKAVAPVSEKGLEAEYYINQIDFRRGNYRKVADASRRLLVDNLGDQLRPETLRVTGLSLFKLGEKDKARPYLEEYVATAGEGAENSAVYTLGVISYDRGDYFRAKELFSTLTGENNDLSQSAWLYLGQILAIEGDAQGAALAFDRAVKESWNHDVSEAAAYNLSVASASGGRLPFADSAALMEEFISTYPDSPYADTLSRYLANAYYSQHDYANALRQIERVASPDAATAAVRQKILYQYGMATLLQGEAAEAVTLLRQASAAGQPDRDVAAQASLWLGDAYYTLKKYRDAAGAYAAAVDSRRMGANLSLANYNLGYARMKLGEYSQAATAFSAALGEGGLAAPQTADARLRLADCQYYTGRYAEALKEFRAMAKGSGPNAVYASVREADILGREGKVGEKIAILQRLADSGNCGEWTSLVLSRLADAYSENGDDRRAADIYARLLDSNSADDNTQLYHSLATNADNLLAQGDRQAALAAYRRVEQSGIAALYPGAVIGIMRSSFSPAEIESYAAKAMMLPGIPAEDADEARYIYGSALLRKGGAARDEGMEMLGELAASSDRLWGAKAALALGQYYLDSGNAQKAEEVLLALVDDGCDDPYTLARGYILLADACNALGKDYLGRLYLETLRSNYSGSEKDIFEMIDSRLK